MAALLVFRIPGSCLRRQYSCLSRHLVKRIVSVGSQDLQRCAASPHYARDAAARSSRWSCHRAGTKRSRAGGRVVCGAKRIRSLYLPWMTGGTPKLSTTAPPKSLASLSTLNAATIRLCRADLPASHHPRSQQAVRALCGLPQLGPDAESWEDSAGVDCLERGGAQGLNDEGLGCDPPCGTTLSGKGMKGTPKANETRTPLSSSRTPAGRTAARLPAAPPEPPVRSPENGGVRRPGGG